MDRSSGESEGTVTREGEERNKGEHEGTGEKGDEEQ